MLATCGAQAAAANPDREVIEIINVRDFTPRSDRAYLLFRIPAKQGPSFEPVLLRIPSALEMDQYHLARTAAFQSNKARLDANEPRNQGAEKSRPEPVTEESFGFEWNGIRNLQNIDFGKPLIKTKEERTYLVEVLPADYVLYGVSYATGTAGLHTCFCLGTIGFSLAPGHITDMGYFLADGVRTKSLVPELAEESDFGPSSDVLGGLLLGGTVRPTNPQASLPDGLKLPVQPALFRAISKFYNPGAGGVNRLVAIPGILGYDRGRVINLQTGRVAPDQAL